ncbi:MAG: PepSY domain-containing protein [Rhizomicrobium sp.]
MSGRAYIAVFLAVLALAFPAMAPAQGVPPPAAVRAPPMLIRHPAPDVYGFQPLDRILPAIRSGRPGRFFDAEGPFPDGVGGWHYRIKWLTPEGRVVWLDADARSGKVLGPYRGYGRAVMPPSGLRYYPFAPGPRGFRGRRFGGWRPGGGRRGWGPVGRRR